VIGEVLTFPSDPADRHILALEKILRERLEGSDRWEASVHFAALRRYVAKSKPLPSLADLPDGCA
jgi:hypothetical protein